MTAANTARAACAIAFTATLCFPVQAKDIYPSFTALAADNQAGKDYRVQVLDRKSPVTVFVIHGGAIEPGTKETGLECAGTDWNLYIFEAPGEKHSMRLHVTAAHFDDPSAIALATNSITAISIHGARDKGESVCVGGANKAEGRTVTRELEKSGFAGEFPCKRLPGASSRNIVNRTRNGGVQLEISSGLASRLKSDSGIRAKFCAAVRKAVHPDCAIE
ncbi:MAG: poly-gamma-glutamate hydrolase family protein [Elusimicrobiales bacterium]|nr:poly-gamma-glutamate hydrolase family protein [Elusimicrobiales bacterium]